MTVENGVIKHAGIITGVDNRWQYCEANYTDPRHQLAPPYKAPGSWCYGCSITLPWEWALRVNGFPEECDGLGSEDSMFGLMLENNGFPIFYDPRMIMVEDRTPSQLAPESRREDYGKSPLDYSHYILAQFTVRKRAAHGFDLRLLRDRIQAGAEWPKPWGPFTHPWTKQPLGEL